MKASHWDFSGWLALFKLQEEHPCEKLVCRHFDSGVFVIQAVTTLCEQGNVHIFQLQYE